MIMRNLQICHINARSIYASRCHNKLDELAVVASVHDFDVLCVTESWLSSHVDNNSCIPLSGCSQPFPILHLRSQPCIHHNSVDTVALACVSYPK